MIEKKAKKGKRRDRVQVVTGGFSEHMGKEHIDSLEGFGNSLSSLILTSNSLMEKAVVDLRFFPQSYVVR